MKKQEYDKRLLKLKKECGWWGRGYLHTGRFMEGLEKLNKEFSVRN